MKKIIILTIFTFVITVLGAYFYVYAKSRNCDICERGIDEKRGAIIRINIFQWKKACCVVCALRYMRDEKKEGLSVLVRDFNSGKYIDAERAYYITGSTERSCCSGNLKREQTGVYFLCYDRCIPDTVAFEKIEDAEQFRGTKGGRIITYAELKGAISPRGGVKKEMISAPIAQ